MGSKDLQKTSQTKGRHPRFPGTTQSPWRRHSKNIVWGAPRYLQEVGSDALVRALLGHLLGQAGDLVGGLGDVLGALDQGALVAAAAADQARHLGHEQRHALRRRDDVVALPEQHGHCPARGEMCKEVKGGRMAREQGRGFFKEQGRSVLTTRFWLFQHSGKKSSLQNWKKKLSSVSLSTEWVTALMTRF